MGAPPKQDWREARRKRAWDLNQHGWLQKDIAAALGVSAGGQRWGGQSLADPHPLWRWRGRADAASRAGARARLTVDQRAQIPALLEGGAEAYGFRGDVWTTNRVAEVIWQRLGYSRDHISALLRRLGWSRQQPLERATQRNASALRQWSEECWPTLKMGGRTANYRRLSRRVSVLSAPVGRADLGATRTDANPAQSAQS